MPHRLRLTLHACWFQHKRLGVYTLNEEFVEFTLKSLGPLDEGMYASHRLTILYPGDITPKQAGVSFHVLLRHSLDDSDLPEDLPDAHPRPLDASGLPCSCSLWTEMNLLIFVQLWADAMPAVTVWNLNDRNVPFWSMNILHATGRKDTSHLLPILTRQSTNPPAAFGSLTQDRVWFGMCFQNRGCRRWAMKDFARGFTILLVVWCARILLEHNENRAETRTGPQT